jgi:outer membrane protein W
MSCISRPASLTTVLILSWCHPVLAAEDGDWILRSNGLYAILAGDEAVLTETQPPPVGEDTLRHEVTGGPGIGLGVEYMLTGHIGLEVAAQVTFHDSEGTITNDLGTFKATDAIDLYTFDYGANWHFGDSPRADWSVGLFVPVMFSDDVDLNFPDLDRKEVFRYDQDYGLGIKLGLDWATSDNGPWSLNAELRYKELILESEDPGGDLDVDPLTLALGFAYRF